MTTADRLVTSRAPGVADPRLVLASRGDPLTAPLGEALSRRFGTVATISPELTASQRYLVAAATVRPTRERWVERFYKSGLAWGLRSGNAVRQLRALSDRAAVVVQVHGLFTVPGASAIVYVDCTHRQSAELWPAWNPLRGQALEAWYRRERSAYRRARHLFAFSTATRDSLVDDYGVPPERVTVTGAAPNLAPPSKSPKRLGTGRPTILFVGNDFARKGGYELLAAFRTVRGRMPGARLVLVGTPPAIAPEPGVEVVGRVTDPLRMAELFAEADLFALPSIFDPFPGALIEAMAHGLPVVATHQMGVPEIVSDGRTGHLVAPGDAAGLADALLRVLDDPRGSAELGAAAQREVAGRFTWDAVVERMSPVLEPLLR